MQSNEVLIQLNNVSFKYASSDFLFKDLNLTIKKGDRTAIVGVNGSGKSTLLKLLTNELPVEEGQVTLNCKPYYVPQIDLTVNQRDLLIYEYISKYYENWWEIPSEAERLVSLSINTDSLVSTLSGGELMKLNLTIALSHDPDVLILDEPTNHLDVKSINALIEFIKSAAGSKYTYVIVSHDVFFINNVVTKIWELDKGNITAYGGNYDFYIEQKELHLRGLKRQYDIAKSKLEKVNENEQKEIEKRANRANKAKLAFIKGSIDKTEYSEGKMAAGNLQKSTSSTIERLKNEAEEILEQTTTEERQLAFMNIKNTKENFGRTIFEIKQATLTVQEKVLIDDIKLKVEFGDRLLIAGNNGTGKSSFIKALLEKGAKYENSQNIKLEGDFYFGDNLNWVYIDQNYSLIKPDLDLVQNVMAYNSKITEDLAKEQLGKYKFKSKSELSKLGNNLSGGEMVRLVMAMITSHPVDILIMDEPTNNLDVATVDVLTKSLYFYKGALILISHNVDFLTKVNIQSAYMIKNKRLNVMNAKPEDRDGFYRALSK